MAFEYQVKPSEAGTVLPFSATGVSPDGTECKGDDVEVVVFKVAFEVVEWTPVVAPPTAYNYGTQRVDVPSAPSRFSPGVDNYIKFVDFNPAPNELFKAKTQVRIKIAPDRTQLGARWKQLKPVADGCCSKWTLQIVQAIDADDRFEKYSVYGLEKTVKTVWNAGPPIRDGKNAQAPPVKFGGVDTVRQRTCSDSPGVQFRMDWMMIEGGGVKDPAVVKEAVTNDTFYTWVVAQHLECEQEVVLAWCRWSFNWQVAFDIDRDITPTKVKIDWVKKLSALEDSGLGAGPKAVVWTPTFDRKNGNPHQIVEP